MLVSINGEEMRTLLEALSGSISLHQEYRDDYKQRRNETCAAIEQSRIDEANKMIDKLFKQAKQV